SKIGDWGLGIGHGKIIVCWVTMLIILIGDYKVWGYCYALYIGVPRDFWVAYLKCFGLNEKRRSPFLKVIQL
ncbi:MAG: hypothetical protein MJK14_12435, partial [Rivularia sp. ALOHA_DT_140]|nr:hypothetical protein [Rivularia sp. ALOHA_DT_140]